MLISKSSNLILLLTRPSLGSGDVGFLYHIILVMLPGLFCSSTFTRENARGLYRDFKGYRIFAILLPGI